MDILLEDVNVVFGGNVLIESSRLSLVLGKRYGFVGNSGIGKSSLLRLMAKGEIKDWPQYVNTVMVQQDVNSTDPLFCGGKTPLECAERSTLPADPDHPERDEIKRRTLATQKLKLMGFGEKRKNEIFETLSQGWKQRLAIVCAVLRQPEVLLLDEPSDAIDLPGVIKLERFILQDSDERITIIVSHDEAFLKKVTTDVLYIQECKLKCFPGDYSMYLNWLEERAKAMEARMDATDRKKEAAEAFIRKQQGSLDPNKQKQAKEKKDKLERLSNYREDGKYYKTRSLKKLDESAVRLPDKVPEKLSKAKEMHFQLPDDATTRRPSKEVPLISFNQVNIGYGPTTPPVLKDVTMQLSLPSRVALVGANSSGKSTLMKSICNGDSVSIQGGSTSIYSGLSVAYVPQRAGEALAASHGASAPAEYLLLEKLAETEQEARQYLGKFGLTGKLGVTHINLLSGGQRTRLAIAISCAKAKSPHLLILDEPSHGLDAPARKALSEALQGFPGGLLVSSHDREFLREGGFNELWITGGNKLRCVVARKEEEEEDQIEAFNEIFDQYLDSL